MKLLKTIELDTTKGELLLDGVPFGYYLADEPVVCTLESKGFGSVTITLVAERVSINAS